MDPLCWAPFGSPSGGASAPHKGLGPKGQDLGAGGIHFRRACEVVKGSPFEPWLKWEMPPPAAQEKAIEAAKAMQDAE